MTQDPSEASAAPFDYAPGVNGSPPCGEKPSSSVICVSLLVTPVKQKYFGDIVQPAKTEHGPGMIGLREGTEVASNARLL